VRRQEIELIQVHRRYSERMTTYFIEKRNENLE